VTPVEPDMLDSELSALGKTITTLDQLKSRRADFFETHKDLLEDPALRNLAMNYFDGLLAKILKAR